MSGGDLIADVLERHGVRFLFTLCGGHISPILVSAKARGIRVVDTRHEATAVFAADAAARMTGVPGVAAVTAGPGVTNTLTALKNAQMALTPLVLLGGATATLLEGRGALQDIDQVAVVRPHVKRTLRVRRVRDLAPALEEALHVCRAGVPGPVFVECPVDVLYPEAVVRQWYGAKTGGPPRGLGERIQGWYIRRHLDRLFARSESSAAAKEPEEDTLSETSIRRTASLLRSAERPVLLVGSEAVLGGSGATALAQAVGALGVPVYLSGMARGLLGAHHPLQRRHRRKEALREADLVILAGVPCDFRLDYGRHIGRGATLVAAGRRRAELRRNRRPAVAVIGLPGAFLQALSGARPAPRDSWKEWSERLQMRDQEREDGIREQAMAEAPGGLNPLAVCQAVDDALAPRSVVVADGGDFVSTASYILRPRAPLSWLDPGVFGTLGVGAGFALAAKLVRPEAEVWIVYGDGSVGYSLAEADTFVRHGLGVIAVVGNDGGWTQIGRDQVELLKDDVGTVLDRAGYEASAAGLGAHGLRLDDPSETTAVLAEAKRVASEGRPVYVNARIGRTDFRKGSISI